MDPGLGGLPNADRPRRHSLGAKAAKSPEDAPRGLRIAWMGQAGVMGKLIRRSTILTAAFAPIAALSLITAAAGSAQPLDCQNGEWWDPVASVCQPPLAPFPPNCGDGQYWNPVSNACRPLGQV